MTDEQHEGSAAPDTPRDRPASMADDAPSQAAPEPEPMRAPEPAPKETRGAWLVRGRTGLERALLRREELDTNGRA